MTREEKETPKSKREIELEAEVLRLQSTISDLRADIRVRDEELRYARRPKRPPLDPSATDRFRRPFRG